jgi:putative endonuclease
MLFYYECYNEIHEAIRREKIIKKWKRKFKVNAIEKMNSEWKDLYFEIFSTPDPATSAG